MKSSALIRSLIVALGLASFGGYASAQVMFTVSVDTSGLSGSTGYVEFSLSDGTVTDGTGPSTANNASLGSFQFGGGSAGAILPPTIGLASGDMGSSITLADGDAGGVADLAQAFTMGSVLKFNVTLSESVQAGTPDEFLFRLLDSTQNYYTTSDPSGNNALVRVDITKNNLGLSDISAYGSTGSSFPTPTVSIVSPTRNGTPEPGALALLAGCGAASLLAVRRRKRTAV